jgi:hypothetical protein
MTIFALASLEPLEETESCVRHGAEKCNLSFLTAENAENAENTVPAF